MRKILVAVVAALVSGCGLLPPHRVAEPSVRSGEAAQHGDGTCPDSLPIDEDPDGYGFGVEDEADELPSLLEPERAWVCRYVPEDIGRAREGGTRTGWPLSGSASELPSDRIDDFADAVDDLTTLPGEYACTADLGPRWLVVYEHGGDLTGVVVDDYGCDFVRVTEDPFTAPAGQSAGQGMVRGVLDGGGAILDVLDR